MNKLQAILSFVFLICIAPVLGAKTYKLGCYDAPPNVTLGLLEGGTLDQNTTYHYRAVTSTHRSMTGAYNFYYSAPSDVRNITTNETHRTVNMTFSHVTGNPEYTWGWVHKDTNPGIGNWTNGDDYPNVYSLGSPGTSLQTIKGLKLNQYNDSGERVSAADNDGSNYAFVPLYEREMCYLFIYGGTESDNQTFQDIYEFSQINDSGHWNETITLIDYDQFSDMDIYGGTENYSVTCSPKYTYYGYNRPTYLIQGISGMMVWDGTFDTIDSNLIFVGCQGFSSYVGTNLTFGRYDESADLSRLGVDVTSFGHGANTLGLGMRNARIYDSKFRGRNYLWSASSMYGSTFNLMTDADNHYEIIDSTVGGYYDRGMSISTSTADSIIKRVKNYDNRWESNFRARGSGNYIPPIIDGWEFYVSDAGAWFSSIISDMVEIQMKNLKIRLNGGNTILYCSKNYTGVTYYTQLQLINPDILENDWGKINWYGGLDYGGPYVKESYTFNLNLRDRNNTDISGMNISLYNNTGGLIYTNVSNTTGQITEGIIVSRKYTPNETATSSCLQKDCGYYHNYNPFTLVITDSTGQPVYNSTFNITKPIDWTITPSGSNIDYGGTDEIGFSLILGLGAASLFGIFFAMILKREHTLLKLLLAFFALVTLILIPTTFINGVTTTAGTFLKATLWLLRIFATYIFLYFVYTVYLKSKLLDLGLLKRGAKK